MKCEKCGADIKVGQKYCAYCGKKVRLGENMNPPRVATIFITEEEASNGCVKVLNLPGLAAPLRFNITPGIKDQQVLKVKNAYYVDANGKVSAGSMDVIVCIQKSRWKKPKKQKKRIWLAAVCIFLVLCMIVSTTRKNENDPLNSTGSQEQMQGTQGNVFADSSNQRYGGKTKEEILKDVISSDGRITQYGLVVTDAVITKSFADENRKSEYVWIDISARNDDFQYDASYRLEYVKYNEGWMLEDCRFEKNYHIALNNADEQIVEEYLRKVNNGKYSTGSIVFVSSDRFENNETVVCRVVTPGNTILKMEYEVEVDLEFEMAGGWTATDYTELHSTETWDVEGRWEYHSEYADIVVDVHNFDAVNNIAVVEYSVVTYIDLEKYQNDHYAVTTTRMTPGQEYKSGRIQVNLVPYTYGGAIQRDYIVYDTQFPDKDLFTVHFCGSECSFINVYNEGEIPNHGVCVFLEGWGGTGGCAFWLYR